MKPTLVVLAAGLGARFGGPKQLEPVGPRGEALLEYTVFDALHVGFGPIILVIREEIEEPFRRFVAHFAGQARVELASQDLETLPPGFELPPGRTKPWGTGHALLAAAELAGECCGLANADDFYGRAALATLAARLSEHRSPSEHELVGFRLDETLSPHGPVSRALCRVGGEGLEAVEELVEISRGATGIVGRLGGQKIELTGEETVSLNLWGFRRGIFAPLRERFAEFLVQRGSEPTAEFFLPDAVCALIGASAASVRVAASPSAWLGLTYRADREAVAARLAELHDRGIYPSPLWR